jgi:Pentapeptide repeats (8 copies)
MGETTLQSQHGKVTITRRVTFGSDLAIRRPHIRKELTIMRLMAEVFIPVLLVGCLVAALAVAEEREISLTSCEGPYKGRTLTSEELATVLRNHPLWLKPGREQDDKRRANLCQADLNGANLEGAKLRGANLAGGNLAGANLARADLRGAALQKANLHRAALYWAALRGADLARADLSMARLVGADLYRADLEGVELGSARLQGTIYEPHPEKLPNFLTLTHPHSHLETLVFHRSPAALI